MDGSLFLPALLTGIFCYLGAIESPCIPPPEPLSRENHE